jgi:RNA polymerase sigma factor (TIGR02999 family)
MLLPVIGFRASTRVNVPMNNDGRSEITKILLDLHADDIDRRAAADRLFEVTYNELRRLASGLRRRARPDGSLQTTALVHEAYLNLVDDTRVEWQSRAHFFGIAARAMRQILVDNARRRNAAKRGGGWQKVALDDALGLTAASDVEVLCLEEALTRLGEMHKRMARIVEFRIFGGLTVAEIAQVIGFSRQTIHSDWRVAKMWINRELAEGNLR